MVGGKIGMSDYEHISQKIRKARKKHVCIWCGDGIIPGEEYVDRVYRWEGEFTADKMHPECHRAMQDSDEACEGFEPFQHKRGSNDES